MLHNHFYFARKPRKNSQYLIKTDFPEGNHCLQEKIFKLSPKSDLCFPEISMELTKRKKKVQNDKKILSVMLHISGTIHHIICSTCSTQM